MEIPRFDNKNINPRLASTDIGDAFQRFVHELLLPEHPQLHRFPGGGKDGGIDLIETSDRCYVVECKVVGNDNYNEIRRRWKTVRDNLEEHLCDPNGPTPGQSQFGPWYSADIPISEYVFSVSASFGNEQQRRELEKAITDFFHCLAERHPHLSHLAGLNVSIIDWNDLCDCLKKRPQSIFRWFPSSRPNGLVPLDEAMEAGTFRTYLSNAKLPYHGLAEHLRIAPPPPGVNIFDEDYLLSRLDSREFTGLVITGKGGIGKSRLTLELGWLALRKGESVLRVQNRLKEDALERLVEKLTPDKPALLLVDYVETQSDFGELVESLNVLNDSGVARLHYIAACRTGYYYQAIATSGRHYHVDLTPPLGAGALEWFAGYRRATIQRILENAGLVVTEQHLAVCRDLPILAVFIAYLQTSGRGEDLSDLLAEVEFGRWVAKRVQQSFAEEDVSRKLGFLIPLFPMADSVARRLSYDAYRPIFDRLAADGWIERIASSDSAKADTWVAAHDVLADQILSSYLRQLPYTADAFVAELLSFAADAGCLSSAIVSLQRIADTPPLNAVDWTKLIADAITADVPRWREVRNLLIKTSLLSPPEQIALLQVNEQLWAEAEKDVSFQKSLGWLARWAVTAKDGSLEDAQRKGLVAWVSKAVVFADKRNFVITWGLRLAPEAVRETALRWIHKRPLLFQTHYLMVAWLECKLPAQQIAAYVQCWVRRFPTSFHLSFLAPAWLDAGGDKALVEEAIKEWLVDHKTKAEAGFVYRAWLDAGEDKALVRNAIGEWLTLHSEDFDADYVFRSWLEAGGERDVVWEATIKWLAHHRNNESAVYVTKFIAKQPNLPFETVKYVLEWCRTFPTHKDVLWRLTQLSANLFVAGIGEEVVFTSEIVLADLLSPTSCPESIKRGQVTTLLSYLITLSENLQGALRDRVDKLFAKWMRHPLSYGNDPKPHPNIQRISYLHRFQLLLDAGILDVANDRELLQRFAIWLNAWNIENKNRVLPIINEIKDRHPAEELWEIVRFG